MKRPFFLLCAAWLSIITTSNAAIITAFDVGYTNAAYTVSTNDGSDRASGVWIGNLRGNETWRDLIVANKADNTVAVRLGQDNGTLGSLTNYAVDLSPVGVRSIDLDGDGYEDIITANSGTNTISVLINLGSGADFAAATNYTVGSIALPEPIALAINDINADGSYDVLVANATENSITILTNATDGTLAIMTNCTVGSGPYSIHVVDLTGDTLADILTANKTDGTLSILPQQNDGTFGAIQTITLFEDEFADPQPVHALAIKVDTNDTLVDIVVANYNSNCVSILLNDGAWGFSVYTNYDVSGPSSLAVRDLNLDGKLDIAVANQNDDTISVLLNLGDGSFSNAYTFAAGSSPSAIATSNFDPGGVPDLVVANNGTNSVSLFLYDRPRIETQTVVLNEDGSKSFTLRTHVYSGRTTNYTILDLPDNGPLTGTEPSLTFTPDTNYFGTDTLTYEISDGVYNSATANVSLRVIPVNDRPSFEISTNLVVATKLGAINILPGFITTSSTGPANESSQILSYKLITNTGNFFVPLPLVRTNALVFKPKPGVSGTNVIEIRVTDNGGTGYGGKNTSLTNTFSIVVPSNPFLTLTGAFHGLFSVSTGVTFDSAGYFTFTLGSMGTFSGKTVIGKSYSFSSQFDVNRHASFTVSRGTNGSPLTFELDLEVENETDQVTGTVSDGVWTADVLGYRLSYNASNPAPQAGKYTMLIPGGDDPELSPTGSGYGLINVTTNGIVKLSGLLADQKSITQTAGVSTNGYWPLYVSLYYSRGAIMGWLQFTNQDNTSLTGMVTWTKTAIPTETFYPDGFTITNAAIGSSYVPPAVGNRIIDLPSGVVTLSGGNLDINQTNNVTLSTLNKITVTSGTNRLSLVISTNLGTISGSFRNPTTSRTSSIRGVVFQEQDRAGGFLIGTNQGGAFFLEAP